jgi:pimeloyl-ACP methyl ester carboxylesterase
MVGPAPVSGFPAKRPWYHPLALLQRLAIYTVIGYITICVYLSAMQTSIIYVGSNDVLSTAAAIGQAKAEGLVPWAHTTPGATAPQGYVRADFANPAPRGTVVVFHGNGGWALDRLGYVEALTRRGFRVFLYEYPGYGGRPGRPSEAAIVPDAQVLVRSLDQAGYGPVYVWGESLGSGVAAAICADATLPVHGLVLLTPWDNIANVGLHFYPFLPVRLLMGDKYDSVANLEHFQHPICVIRSKKDEVIPPPLTLNLYAHLPEPKKMIEFDGAGHNDWPNSPELSWWDDALNFIALKK